MKYILSGHEPVRCDDITEWGRFMWQHELRVVAQDDVGPHWVSTVFMIGPGTAPRYYSKR